MYSTIHYVRYSTIIPLCNVYINIVPLCNVQYKVDHYVIYSTMVPYSTISDMEIVPQFLAT